MSVSDELRNLAESWAMNGDIPSYVKHDLDTLAIDVSEIERERDERHIVTTQEHGRVVQAYIDMLAEKNEENDKLRELVETMHGDMREMLDTIDKGSETWGYCRYYGECLDAAEGIMRELGIEVKQ